MLSYVITSSIPLSQKCIEAVILSERANARAAK
jgi:hypothetical protein